ncbi:MAG: TetR family transcriptional regulator [Pseudonocardiales bacterium]|nr:MAG: TetR family transcriptional regulator [Pseudonocardiales bacterium]
MIEPMSTRQRGRPRDPAINDAILKAARELLVEFGYAEVSMEAVATRAGVSKPTLYLRWPSKGVLIWDAVFENVRSVTVPERGDLATDLRAALELGIADFASPEARAALPGMLAELTSSLELARLVRARVIEPNYARMHGLLERARRRGAIRADVDLTLVIDALFGTALARATVLGRPLDGSLAEQLVDLVVAGLAPRHQG